MKQVSISINAEIKGEYDVIVCGGGTAGCVAALASARNGAKTILLESSNSLGGMMTVGNAGLTKFVKHAIDEYEQAKISEELKTTPENVQIAGGIPLELVHKLIKRKAAMGTNGTAASYVYTDSQEFKLMLFEMLLEAKVEISLHSSVFDVIKEGNRITGIFYHTKQGAFAVTGKYIIDATGDGDVAAFAGVPYVIGSCENDAVVKQGLAPVGEIQPIGTMYRIGGVDFDKYIAYLKENPQTFVVQDFGLMSLEDFISEYEKGEMIISRGLLSNRKRFQVYNYPQKGIMIGCVSAKTKNLNGVCADDLTKAEYEVMVSAKEQVEMLRKEVPGFENAFVLDVQAGVRETRHIEGEYMLNINDILSQRQFEDTIGFSSHPVDINPYPKECYEYEKPKRFYFSIPYKCLVAKGVDNLLLAGRLVSNTREAAGCTRPTVPCMVTGEAAGTASAILCGNNTEKAIDIDVQTLRKTLRDNGVKL